MTIQFTSRLGLSSGTVAKLRRGHSPPGRPGGGQRTVHATMAPDDSRSLPERLRQTAHGATALRATTVAHIAARVVRHRRLPGARSALAAGRPAGLPLMFAGGLVGLAAALSGCSVTINGTDTTPGAPATSSSSAPRAMTPQELQSAANDLTGLTQAVDSCIQLGQSCDEAPALLGGVNWSDQPRADYASLVREANSLQQMGYVGVACYTPLFGVKATNCASPARNAEVQRFLDAVNELRNDVGLSALPMPSHAS